MLIEAYEREHHSIDPPDPADAIRFRMEQSDLTAADLASLLGVSRRRALAVLRGESMTLPMIRLLVERLGISADVLVRGSAIAARRPEGLVQGHLRKATGYQIQLMGIGRLGHWRFVRISWSKADDRILLDMYLVPTHNPHKRGAQILPPKAVNSPTESQTVEDSLSFFGIFTKRYAAVYLVVPGTSSIRSLAIIP